MWRGHAPALRPAVSKFSGELTGRWTGIERLYAHVQDWNYGRDLDFISYLEVLGNTIWANAYRMRLGQSVQWLVRARVNLVNTTETHNSGFFPPQFRHPHNNPNETATRFPFYTTQVQ